MNSYVNESELKLVRTPLKTIYFAAFKINFLSLYAHI